ncbi:MAG: flagellar motor switch protein FliM [Candidatus Latescibacterota bacterium]|jgi:flagellar motor switch protein FliM|tara:strand:+ start:119 stop:1174 length:1056 start_codon:yes stop_codon:yes gene_type:complete
MADILSQEEIDALLSATDGDDGGGDGDLGDMGGGDGGFADAGSQRIVTSYDFKHPARVNKDQLRTLENLHDNFARLLSSTFSGAMRAVVDVDTAFVDQTTYAEFIMSLSNPSCSYQFTLGPTNGQAIIDFAMPVVFAFVDRIFGGKGSSQGVEARQLTPIEIGVINRIVKRVIEDLEATWEPILRVEITDIELETNPEFMQITAASEIVILLAFEVNSTNASGLVSLCYPFFTLESILPRLGQQSYVRTSRMNQEEMLRQNNLRLQKTHLPIRVELARGMTTFRTLQDLQIGDVLTLDTEINEPTIIYVNDEPKYIGRPGRMGRKNAVQITEYIDAENEVLFKNKSQPTID